MNARPVVAAVFVALCLLLCGLILRRQIAGHPLPPEARQSYDFHPASLEVTRQAQDTIGGQVAALNAGDGSRAWLYQSRALRHNFSGVKQFLQMINARYPEFGQSRLVRYGPVWVEPGSGRAQARVIVEGKNGREVRGVFQLVREGGALKVDGFFPADGFKEGRAELRQR